ncbi:MAG TPA: hypothetical protein VGW34_07975 [Allosphingosinicella sp.]|nr:hypothetical protein [Allosphingosinicella sp.]
MSLFETMREARETALRKGRRPRRWEVTVPALREIGRELSAAGVDLCLPADLHVGIAALPLLGVPVAVVPGPRIAWTLIVDRAEGQQP